MTDFNGSRVLITGGLGFIGSNLAIDLADKGAVVTLVDSLIPEYGGNIWNVEPIRDRVIVNVSDVRDPFSMKHLLQGQDCLFNLAGQTSHLDSMINPFPDLEINARAQLSILEACRQYNPGIKIVYASTRQVYGRPHGLPVDERHPLMPVDINGVNKLAGEWYHILYNNIYGIRTVVLRLTNTYGPRMRVVDARQTFLGIWIRCLIEQKPILVYGDGKQIRDFNYVSDVVEALELSAISDDAGGQVFNLGADDPMSLLDVAKMLSLFSEQGSYQLVDFPGEAARIDIGDYYADYRKFRSKLGWQPQVPLREGLKKTVEYYKEHWQHYWA